MAGRRWRVCRRAGLGLIATAVFAVHPPPLAGQQTFPVADATQLFRQIAGGLTSHNPQKMLAAFNLSRMQDGVMFEQHTLSFFRETGTIRVHFNLVRTEMEGARGIASANMELEADLVDDRRPPLYKQAQLRLVCERSENGWRIVELTPRDFFSTQP